MFATELLVELQTAIFFFTSGLFVLSCPETQIVVQQEGLQQLKRSVCLLRKLQVTVYFISCIWMAAKLAAIINRGEAVKCDAANSANHSPHLHSCITILGRGASGF